MPRVPNTYRIESPRAAVRARRAIVDAISAGYDSIDAAYRGPARCRFCRECASRPHSPTDCEFHIDFALSMSASVARTARESHAGPKPSPREWDAIIRSQRGRCFDCKAEIALTRGHLVPIADGGTNELANIIAQCRRCNSAQGVRVHPEAHRRGVALPKRERSWFEGGGTYRPRVDKWRDI